MAKNTKNTKKDIAVSIVRAPLECNPRKESTMIRFAEVPSKDDHDALLKAKFKFYHDSQGYYFGSFKLDVEFAKQQVEMLGYRPTFEKIKKAEVEKAEAKEGKKEEKGKPDSELEKVAREIGKKLKGKDLAELKKISALIDLL